VKRGFIIRTAAVLLLFLIGAVPAGADQRLDQSRRDLESIRQQIEQTSESLEEKQRSAHRLADQLSRVDHELRQARRKVAQLQGKLKDLQLEIDRVDREVQQGKSRIRDLESEVRRRLVALYKGGDAQLVKILFSARPPAEIFENYDFLQRLVRHDRELIGGYLEQVKLNQQRLADLDRLRADRAQALEQFRGEEGRLEKSGSEKKRLLAQARKDRDTLALLLADLEERAERLSALVKKLESQKPGSYTEKSTAFASRKGRLRWPVKGSIRLGFGRGVHPDLGTRYDSHGLEIEVRGVVPITAVWDGQVIFANQFRGYGNLVIVDHGDGFYSLYAQASRLTKGVGERVAEGETVAFSGFDGGDAVYFEIRQGGTPLDPTDWLAARP